MCTLRSRSNNCSVSLVVITQLVTSINTKIEMCHLNERLPFHQTHIITLNIDFEFIMALTSGLCGKYLPTNMNVMVRRMQPTRVLGCNCVSCPQTRRWRRCRRKPLNSAWHSPNPRCLHNRSDPFRVGLYQMSFFLPFFVLQSKLGLEVLNEAPTSSPCLWRIKT